MSNMYEFTPDTINFISGACAHKCRYCYVNNLKKRNDAIRQKYSGNPSLSKPEFKKNLGQDRFWFVGTMIDMFAADVPGEMIQQVLDHCSQFNNKYLFQSKNPKRFLEFKFPKRSILCTTIESNRDYPGMSLAPKVADRVVGIDIASTETELPSMITIEPALDFDVHELFMMIVRSGCFQVNIGADSKGHRLPEPTWGKIAELVLKLNDEGIKVHLKPNLARLRNE